MSSTGRTPIVFPGDGSSYREAGYTERYFALEGANRWITEGGALGREFDGDCDGDGIVDGGFGLLCNESTYWWNVPGRRSCDTLSDAMICEQAQRSASVYSQVVAGLRDFAVRDGFVFVAKNRKLVVADASGFSPPAVIAELDLGAEVRDIDLSPGFVVVAADSGIGIVDVRDPSAPVLARWIHGCGKVTAVKVVDGRIHFLTRLGLGTARLEGDATVPESYTLVYPTARHEWALHDVDPARCDELSHLAETACAWFGCPLDLKRPFDVAKGLALVPAFGDVLVVDVKGLSPELLSVVELPRIVKGIRSDGEHAYVNLLLGGTNTISLSVPTAPVLLGPHEVKGWVDGQQAAGALVLRRRLTTLDLATLEGY